MDMRVLSDVQTIIGIKLFQQKGQAENILASVVQRKIHFRFITGDNFSAAQKCLFFRTLHISFYICYFSAAEQGVDSRHGKLVPA